MSEQLTPIKSVGIVGLGAVGRLFDERVRMAGMKVRRAYHAPGEIERMLAQKPSLVIVATRNPTIYVLSEIAQYIRRPTTIVLPQNGIAVVEEAHEVFDRRAADVDVVRASLATAVRLNEDQVPVYKKKKLRIAVAAVNQRDEDASLKVATQLKAMGFKVQWLDSSQMERMQWTKLLLNTIGTSTPITGRGLRDTLRDSQSFAFEARALKDRKAAMEKKGIPLLMFRWMNPAQKFVFGRGLDLMRDDSSLNGSARAIIAYFLLKERGGQETAAFRRMSEGELPHEFDPYHSPFAGLGCATDAAILEIYKTFGAKKLVTMTTQARFQLLADTTARLAAMAEGA